MTWDRRQATDGYCSARRIDHILTPDEKKFGLVQFVEARNFTRLKDLTDKQDERLAEYRERAT
jgi:hypothetical protein